MGESEEVQSLKGRIAELEMAVRSLNASIGTLHEINQDYENEFQELRRTLFRRMRRIEREQVLENDQGENTKQL